MDFPWFSYGFPINQSQRPVADAAPPAPAAARPLRRSRRLRSSWGRRSVCPAAWWGSGSWGNHDSCGMTRAEAELRICYIACGKYHQFQWVYHGISTRNGDVPICSIAMLVITRGYLEGCLGAVWREICPWKTVWWFYHLRKIYVSWDDCSQ